ncbi:hypothetical protein SEUCBS139899_004542 [Sporothrix eucalyptigena]
MASRTFADSFTARVGRRGASGETRVSVASAPRWGVSGPWDPPRGIVGSARRRRSVPYG